VYSAQKRSDAVPVEVGQYAYRTENAVFMVHGRYYVEAIAFTPSERLFASVETMAEKFVRDTPIEKTSIEGLEWFPREGLDEESLTLVASDAFGFERLNRVYTAEYNMGGARLTAFVSRRQSNDEAAELATAFEGFLKEFGGKDLEIQTRVRGSTLIEIMGTYDVVFSRGSFLAGIHEAPQRETAEQLALKLDKRLKEIPAAQ
jgi:hypothetical protein